MKDDRIPDQDHVARFCRPKHAPDGQIQATAFKLREGEKSLSVNWLEFFKCPSRDKEIDELRRTYSSTFSVGAKAKIAVLTVGEVKQKVLTESPDSRKLDVLHDPIQEDPSHSGIYNYRFDDEAIPELILQTLNESYPARNA